MRLTSLTGVSETIWRELLLAIVVSSVAFPQTPSRIQSLVSAGTLDSMRWPNFRDYQPSLQKLYEPVNYAPAWVNGSSPSSQALAMIELLRNAWKKGLEPEDYDASRWDSRLHAMQGSAADPAEFDVALTVCTMRYISDLRIGRINPQHFKFGLSVEQKKYDLAQFMRERLLPAADPSAVAESVEPPFAGYRRTEQALARYMELARADNSEKLPVPAKPVDPGQAYPGAPRLVRLLRLLGDLPTDTAQPTDSQLYDGTLAEAVKRFQRRHGLDADGRLGPTTVKQLNVPLTDRVKQLQLTLERWRWLPTEYSAPPIIVNISDFRLRALDENNRIALEMRVVAGKAMRSETPVFTRDMTYLVLRPYWNIPPGILRKDVIPAIRRDRSQVVSKNYEITTIDGKIVTSRAVSDEVLAELQAGKLTVRQKPGPNNSLA
jgi:L,D-transpeptidase YcbB